ncbi:arsenite efflux transporter metallochaperone ArsD [Bacillaceae bacterium Marseille-Q3522]|nr:arsenite efflux transporter metallochaperone ArsD [Bacillaceae bacterium Marseille-Q3522]
MTKIEIFDPAMCCSSGVCGPVVDPELVRISIAVQNLKNNAVKVERYNLTADPDKFVSNQTVNNLLKEKGADVLPVTLVNGEVRKEGSYLSNAELASLTGVKEETLGKKPTIRLSISVNKRKKEAEKR